jgi:hypothetical protein
MGGERRRGARLAGLALVLVLVPVPAGPAAGEAPARGRWVTASVAVGFDSFSERYSIEEADTLDLTNELRTALGLELRHAWTAKSRLELAEVLTVSDLALRNRSRLELELAPRGEDRLVAANELTTKRDLDGGDESALASDYVQDAMWLTYRGPLTGVLGVRLREQLEVVDFAVESDYEYDTWRNVAGAGLAIEPDLDASVELDYEYGRRRVPDSSAVDYREHAFVASWWQIAGARTELEAQGRFERRRYREETVRPGYVGLRAGGRVGVRLSERFTLRLRQEVDATSYDVPSQVYYNSVEHLSGLEGALAFRDGEVEAGLEPRYTTLRADEGSGEDYDERSAVIRLSWMHGASFWLDAALELGRRDYRDAGESVFSDYAFARTNVFSTVELGPRTAWNLYLSHEPERHEVEGDDTTTTLVSTDVTVRF